MIAQPRSSPGKPLALPRPIWVYRDEDPVIAQGRYLLDLDVDFLKDFEELLEPLSRLRPPAVDLSKPNEGQGLPYDLWAEETQPGIRVAPIDSIDRISARPRRSPPTSPSQYLADGCCFLVQSGYSTSALYGGPRGQIGSDGLM